ncbi:MAG TPA: helix-turn-helix transcriptional regulator [Clostridiaceae bacterium]|nr:helix-turn-helix transcriptional regulator [Clostridiaceae bacterium]
MKTGRLLKSLLDIADITQKNFAESIYTSPSTISKIITGKHLVSSSDEKSFSAKAARILADNIFETNCYFKFRDILPIICDFISKHDLEQFLLKAFMYAIEIDRENSEDSVNINRPTKYYVGRKQIMHMVCIITSDYLRTDRHELLEFYSALPLSFGYSQLGLDEIKVVPPALRRELIFNQLFDPGQCLRGADDCIVENIETVYTTEQYSELYRWQATLDPTKPFLLLKDKYIILFNQQIDGTPQMTVITNKPELDNIYDHIAAIMSKAKRLTYTESDIEEYLNDKSVTEERLIDSRIRAISEMSPTGTPADEIVEGIRQLMQTFVQDDVSIFISADVLNAFVFSKEVLVPVLRDIEIPLRDRIKILEIIRDYMEANKHANIHIINISLHSITVLCLDQPSLICLINPFSKKAKYHLVDSNVLKEQMEKSSAKSFINAYRYISNLIDQAQERLFGH